MSETNDMRQEFEAWFSSIGKGSATPDMFDVNEEGEYELSTIYAMFYGWQAATERATAVERERCATVCEAMKTMGGTEDVERGWNGAMRRSAIAIRQGGEG